MYVPYSYSKLMHFVRSQQEKVRQTPDLCYELSTVAYSLSNNAVPMIQLTRNTAASKVIVVMARQHPGEVWSSYLM